MEMSSGDKRVRAAQGRSRRLCYLSLGPRFLGPNFFCALNRAVPSLGFFCSGGLHSLWLWGLVVTDSVRERQQGRVVLLPCPHPHPQPRGVFLPASCPTSHPIYILLRTQSPGSQRPHSQSLSAKLSKLAWVLSYMEGRVLKPLFYRFPKTCCKGLRQYKSDS